MLYFLVRELRQGQGFNFPGWGYADVLSADLVGLFTPTRLHPLWGQAAADRLAQFTDVNTLFIGYGVTLLAAAGGRGLPPAPGGVDGRRAGLRRSWPWDRCCTSTASTCSTWMD